MARDSRWTTLLDIVAAEGRVDIEEAAGRLGVSAATVRRDLDELASQHLLVRTRGGAVPHSVSYELPLRYKLSRRREEKHRIADATAGLVAAGSVVGINGGTTTIEVARALAVRADQAGDTGPQMTIVTNALNIAHELAVRPRVKLVLTGGVVRPQSYELVGPLAMPSLERITLDVAILGADGVSAAGGVTTNNEDEAAVNGLMVKRARTVIVVADASKLGQQAFAEVCPATQVDTVVTGGADADGGTSARAAIDDLRAAGVTVRVA
jgi:DeoR family transcriptional regulator of aga operon